MIRNKVFRNKNTGEIRVVPVPLFNGVGSPLSGSDAARFKYLSNALTIMNGWVRAGYWLHAGNNFYTIGVRPSGSRIDSRGVLHLYPQPPGV